MAPFLFKMRSAKWFILLTVTASVFTDLFLFGVVVPVLPFTLQSRVGIDPQDAQYWTSVLLSIFAAGVVVFSPIWGYIADHTQSRRTPFVLGLVALLGSTALFCVGSSLRVLVAGRLVQGIAGAMVWPIGLAIVSDTVGSEKVGEAMGWVTLGVGVALFSGPLLGGIVFSEAGYYPVFIMTFGLIGVDIILRLSMIEAKHATENEAVDPSTTEHDRNLSGVQRNGELCPNEPAQDVARASGKNVPAMIVLLKSPRLLSALYGCLVQAILISSFDSVLPLFVQRTFGWDSLGAGVVYLNLVIPHFLEPVIGALSDKYGVRWMATGGFVGALPFFVLLRFVTYNTLSQKVLLCALLVCIGIAISLVLAPLLAEITRTVAQIEKNNPGVFGGRSPYAQAYGLFNMAFAVGTLIGPLWAGLVETKYGWGSMGWSLGLLSALSAIPTFFLAGSSSSAADDNPIAQQSAAVEAPEK